MHGLRLSASALTLVLLATASEAQDLHFKKNITVAGNVISSTETSIKGARIRDVNQTPAGNTVMLRQCDLKRTVTLNEQTQSYFVANDPQDAAAARAAALAMGTPVPETTGSKIDITTTITDTGERKTMFGYPARHLKIKVKEESSEKACSQVHQSFDIDGWYADLGKELAGCNQYAPPLHIAQGCQDSIEEHHSGTGKPGYPLSQTISMPGPDGPTTVMITVSELSKQTLDKALFDVPESYHQVGSLAELHGVPQMTQPAGAQGGEMMSPTPGATSGMQGYPAGAQMASMSAMGAQQQMMMNQYAAGGGHMPPNMTMSGTTPNQPVSAPIAIPQALGPKAPGKIRIGVAPPDAQVGQGNNTMADYSTPVRNAMILLMNGPVVEVAALDSRVPMQVQAEAQQKQCDYVLFSSVAVKHNSGGSFGKFAKFATPIASMTPIGMMAHGVGSAVATTAASAAASAAAQAAQQQAMSQVMAQLQGFNGQIKSRDDVNVHYELFVPGQTSPVLQNALQGKAKTDGEDVLTPLLQQTANTVVNQIGKK
jgi:hypothetical protein